jgi:hypothetical protein
MTRGTIAIDLDDVLSATNAMVAVIHNELYGTNMTIDDFDYCESQTGDTKGTNLTCRPVRSLVEKQVGAALVPNDDGSVLNRHAK